MIAFVLDQLRQGQPVVRPQESGITSRIRADDRIYNVSGAWTIGAW